MTANARIAQGRAKTTILIYYANVYIAAGPTIGLGHGVGSIRLGNKVLIGDVEAAKSDIRKLASRLRSRAVAIPCYRFFSLIRLVPDQENISKASGALIGISNSIDGYHGRENKERSDEIVKALSLWL